MFLFIVQINFIILLCRIVCCWWRIQSRTQRVFNSWISRRWLQWSRSSCYSHPNWNHHIGDQDPECSWRERSTHPWTDISGTEEIWISWGNCGGLFLNTTLFTTMLDKIVEKFRLPPPPHSRIWHFCCEVNLTNLTKARAVFAVVAKAYRALIWLLWGWNLKFLGKVVQTGLR